MKIELYDYDIYPKVFLAGGERTVTIQPLGLHAAFTPGRTYEVQICAMEEGRPNLYPDWASFRRFSLVPGEDGCLRVTCDFPTEQEYLIEIFSDPGKRLVRLSVYALARDMAGRYPFRGDLHMHTCRSDGREAPDIVCANYRAAGYDFFTVTDHFRYYPSLEVIRKFAPLRLDYSLIPGEEVHLPLTDIHIVNFGGDFSVNGLVEGLPQNTERGDDPAWRSATGECPPVLTREEYERQIRERAKDAPFDSEAARLSYAACLWAFEKIREGHGLGVFAHPYWRQYVFQVPEEFLEVMMREHPFDAFEVLGGENYFEHNGFQTVRYYQDQARGCRYPIVGSTDSHGSTEHNRNARICSTIVFAPDATRDSLVSSVKDFYSVAVDTISPEFRIVGDLRLVKYACFLLNNYFPLHDRLCAIEGELLREYAVGDPKAEKRIEAMRDATSDMRRKYFDL